MTYVNRVLITRIIVGICHMQVCAVIDATDDEILTICNRENPSGTIAGWGRVIREDQEPDMFGDLRPVVCAMDPERRHFMVGC